MCLAKDCVAKLKEGYLSLDCCHMILQDKEVEFKFYAEKPNQYLVQKWDGYHDEVSRD